MSTYFCLRHSKLQNCFLVHNNVGDSSNINDLFLGLRSDHNTVEWGQFNDSSKASLRLFCCLREIILSLAPLAYASGLKKSYETMALVLHLVKHSIYNWNICKNPKFFGLLLGLQIGYTKHQDFLILLVLLA